MQALSSHHLLFPSKHPFVPQRLPAQPLAPPTTKIRRLVSTTTPTTLQVDDDAAAAFWDYQFLFVSQRCEVAQPITLRTIEGAIPFDFPSGTYYLTGPGIFSDDHGSTVHPLDGHGYLRAFSIDSKAGEVRYSARYVDTEAKKEESDQATGKWRFTHRGPFSVLKGGKKVGNTKVMKNVANTSVVKWGGRLLCFWEGGDPYEIDAETLQTVSKYHLVDDSELLLDEDAPASGGGFWDFAATLLKPILYGVFKMPPKRLLSHYKIDPKRGRLLLVSCNVEDMLLPRSTFTFYEFDPNFKLVQQQSFDIPEHLMIHDWAFTDSNYILFGNRIKLDIPGSTLAVCGLSPMISALSVDPSKPMSHIYMFPRFSKNINKNRDWRVPIEAPKQMWLLHVGNAFEKMDVEGNLEVYVQVTSCSYQWFNFQKMFGYDWNTGKLDPSFMNAREGGDNILPHLNQVTIKFDKQGICQKCLVEPLNNWMKPSDFPVINPQFSVLKLDLLSQSVLTWTVSGRRFIGEPIFVSKGEREDEGYLLVIEYAVSIQRCYLVILDPGRIGKIDAVIARLEVPKRLNFPLGFHGFWAANN